MLAKAESAYKGLRSINAADCNYLKRSQKFQVPFRSPETSQI